MKNSPKRTAWIGLLSGLLLYFFTYIVCSCLGEYEWIYGYESSRDGFSTNWDGVGHVPLFFPGDQNHIVNLLYLPLLHLDRRYVHSDPIAAIEAATHKQNAEPASAGNVSFPPATER